VKKGVFSNGVPYVSFGENPNPILVFSGGPGNYLSPLMAKQFSFLSKHYTVYVLSRKSGLPEGYSTSDMAEDFAVVIKDEFKGGPIDVIGESYGGLIAQHLAASHPELVNRLVLAMSAYRFTSEGSMLDMRFAEMLNQGKTRAAFKSMAPIIVGSRIKKAVLSFFMSIFGPRMIVKPKNPADLLVEGKAELIHNSHDQLHLISASTLVIGGDKDFFCSLYLLNETSAGIPNSKLIIHKGKGHMLSGKKFNNDILLFLDKI